LEELVSPEVQTILMDHSKSGLDDGSVREKGSPNGRRCSLCERENKTACHLLFKCPYSNRIWSMVKDCLGLHDFDLMDLMAFEGVWHW
jgi:hypothetical protein